MSERTAEVAAELYAAVARGEEQTIRALLDPTIRWRGRDRGHLWWRHAHSCHGQAEALRNFRLLRHKVPQLRVRDVLAKDDRALVVLTGSPAETDFVWYPLVTVRDGRVVSIRDYGRRSQRARRAFRHRKPS